MTETEDNQITRRQFLKGAVVLAGGAMVAACTPRQSPEAPFVDFKKDIPLPTETADETKLWKGNIQEGESLTGALERISESSINVFANFGLIWVKTNGEIVHFSNKNAFLWQEIIPLPSVWPGDTITFGKVADIKALVANTGLADNPKFTTIDSRTRDLGEEGKEAERTMSVFGGRFNRTVFYKLFEDGWKINYKKDVWVDASKFKDLMNSNPSLTSSQAMESLDN